MAARSHPASVAARPADPARERGFCFATSRPASVAVATRERGSCSRTPSLLQTTPSAGGVSRPGHISIVQFAIVFRGHGHTRGRALPVDSGHGHGFLPVADDGRGRGHKILLAGAGV